MIVLVVRSPKERELAADDNLRKSSSSIDFMSPKSEVATSFRDAVLELSSDFTFTRPFVNSGRWSLPTPYVDSSLNSEDEDSFDAGVSPGSNCMDAPIIVNGKDCWLIDFLGNRFVALVYEDEQQETQIDVAGIVCEVLYLGKDIADTKGLLKQRYDMQVGTVYLFRPDQYVAARWRAFDTSKIIAAIHKASCAG